MWCIEWTWLTNLPFLRYNQFIIYQKYTAEIGYICIFINGDAILEIFSCNFSQALEVGLYWTHVTIWQVSFSPILNCLCNIDSIHF